MDEEIMTMEQEERMNDLMAKHREEAEFDEDDKEESEMSEGDALSLLDREHVEDYLAIRRAVSRTDLAEWLVRMAVRLGLEGREENVQTSDVPF